MTTSVGPVSPEPTEEEAVAIVAALQTISGSGAGAPVATPVSRWRFSGRWWSRPVPSRRVRP